MSGFSNFAISFSIICILSGGINSLSQGTSGVGGAAGGVVWPLGVLLSLFVTLPMAQISSAFPTAGGLYHWSSILGGKGWGWATAWFNMMGLIFVTAAVNVGAWGLFTSLILPLFHIDPSKWSAGQTYYYQAIGVVLITGSQALFNHFGIKVTTILTDFSGYLIFAVSALLMVLLLAFAKTHEFGRLFTFTNYSGDAGGGVWPQNGSMVSVFILSLLWPLYTITGFDASAHTSEETVHAAKEVPKAMIRSVYLSGIFGWIMAIGFVIAMPTGLADGAKQGGNVFTWIMDGTLPAGIKIPLEVGVVLSNYLCGLACVTSVSRMMFAFARDGGLPGYLKVVSPAHNVPVAAIWTSSIMAVLCTLYAAAYTALAASCVIFLYISYVMPTAVGMAAYGGRWTKMGPFNLGAGTFKMLGVFSIIAVALIIYAGVQPPNDVALKFTGGAVALLIVGWFAGIRKVFKGPPVLPDMKERGIGMATPATDVAA
jgi:amino acid transporter